MQMVQSLSLQGVSLQSSVLPPATTVKHKVKGQEAKIVKVKGQA